MSALFGLELDGAGIVSGAAAIVLGAALLGLVTALAVFRDLRRFVLPHFTPPADPAARDNTVPARIARQEERLSQHLVDEEGKVDAITARLDEGDARMARIEEMLRATLEQLGAGNPELRR